MENNEGNVEVDKLFEAIAILNGVAEGHEAQSESEFCSEHRAYIVALIMHNMGLELEDLAPVIQHFSAIGDLMNEEESCNDCQDKEEWADEISSSESSN